MYILNYFNLVNRISGACCQVVKSRSDNNESTLHMKKGTKKRCIEEFVLSFNLDIMNTKYV